MKITRQAQRWSPSSWLWLVVWTIVIPSRGVAAAPYVAFDFARSIECRDVVPAPTPDQHDPYTRPRLVEFALPLSVRFNGLSPDDVVELDVEISGAAAGLRVYEFSPKTQLASDIEKPIETTTTTTRARSLDATLGGELPLPYAEGVAHVAPSLSAGLSGSKTAVEKLHRLPPKHAVVVSGTSSEGRGVFFKLKRSSQTSLEGVHVLAVTFVVPAEWRGGDVRVGCTARGRRKVLWLKQEATLGGGVATVRLYAPDAKSTHQVAKPVLAEAAAPGATSTVIAAAATEAVDVAKKPQTDPAVATE